MKTLMTTTALFLLTSAPALADIIDVDSKIDAAIVFTEGATITRTAKFSAQAGHHQILIDDLPLNFDANSLRVTGLANTTFRIVSVDHRIRRLPPRTQTDTPEYLALEAELEALIKRQDNLTFAINTADTKIDVANGRLRMVETLIEREPQTMVNEATFTPRDATDWGETIGVLAEQMEIALLAKITAEREKQGIIDDLKDVQQEIAEVQQRMTATQLPAQDTSVATIKIVADTAIDGTLNLEYRTSAAGWRPVYDLRLTQGDTANLAIERHARVHQNTGEAWDNVALTLSTARPSLRMDAPMFGEQIVTLWDPQAATSGVVAEDFQVRRAQAPMKIAADTAPVAYETHGRTLTYVLTERADIDGDGTTRQVRIDATTTEVATSARATPRLDPSAYLYATLENSFDGPILPGNGSVYVDGAFIGQTTLPYTAADATLDLPFGVIDGITIATEVTNRETGDYGLVSTTNTREEAFMMTATSVLPYDIPLTIYDRAPVSENEDLKIAVRATPQPSEQDVGGVRGLMAWTLDMQAGSTQVVTFGYDIAWPGDQNLRLSGFDLPIPDPDQDTVGIFR
jgi:uncharacterized protein (TIGR02231 family)